MKTINTFILEKLRINKNINNNSDLNIEGFVDKYDLEYEKKDRSYIVYLSGNITETTDKIFTMDINYWKKYFEKINKDIIASFKLPYVVDIKKREFADKAMAKGVWGPIVLDLKEMNTKGDKDLGSIYFDDDKIKFYIKDKDKEELIEDFLIKIIEIMIKNIKD